MERIFINNYIWLFGENLAKTANNNSYYMWKHIVNIDDNIEKYLVLEKNPNTKRIYATLSKHEKKFVLWKNSFKHFRKFLDADLFFVTLTYKDVVPDKFIFKKMQMRLKKPFIHLQVGVSGLKKLDERGKSYGNNILRFLVYNKELDQALIDENEFKDYQLFYTEYQPKYGELINQIDTAKDTNQILWFLSFREYFRDDHLHVKAFSLMVERIVKDKSLIKFLKDNNFTLKICTHVLLEDNVYRELSRYESDLIKIVRQEDTDMGIEIAQSNLLITDYSSIVYDFSFADKDYILFQPDLDRFIEKRGFYYDHDELKSQIIRKPHELITKVIGKNYDKIDYIENALPENRDFNYLKADKHLDDLYDYFSDLQNHKITFIGYNFYGIGGTVNATMALAESLLEQGCFVEIISMKKLSKILHKPPLGLNMQYITWDGSGSIIEKFYRGTHRSEKNYSHLKYDYGRRLIHPYVGYALNKMMTNIRTNTLVSTRETLHLFVNDCTSENVQNKIYFFHTLADVIGNIFPDLFGALSDITLDKAVFITEQNRLAIKNKFDYTNYNDYINLGNTLIQSKTIAKDEIHAVERKDKYSAIYLLRVSKEREDDLNNLINFAKYVKENGIDFIEVDVFGAGDYVNEFIDILEKEDVNDIIHYKLATDQPIEEIRDHDLMIDFSLNHSFGMTYIEAILNGKKVYCMENPGSIEVMENIPNSYIESYEWLCNQIKDLDRITADELKDNYDKINEKYSQETIANKFLEFIYR